MYRAVAARSGFSDSRRANRWAKNCASLSAALACASSASSSAFCARSWSTSEEFVGTLGALPSGDTGPWTTWPPALTRARVRWPRGGSRALAGCFPINRSYSRSKPGRQRTLGPYALGHPSPSRVGWLARVPLGAISDQVRGRARYWHAEVGCWLTTWQQVSLALPCATRTIPRGLHLRIGSTCETIWSTCIGNERTTSTI